MKLIEITFREAPRLPGVRVGDMIPLKCFEPAQALLGWRACIRGASIFFISPAGYITGRNQNERDPSGPHVIHEVPRVQCYLHWLGSPEEIANITKYDTPPFGPEPLPSEPVAVSPEDSKKEAVSPEDSKKEAPSGGLLAQVGV